jgi:hypothetical protein
MCAGAIRYAILSGFLFLDQHGRPVLQGSPGATGPWKVINQDIEVNNRRSKNIRQTQAWSKQTVKATSEEHVDLDQFKTLLTTARLSVRTALASSAPIEQEGILTSLNEYLKKMNDFYLKLSGLNSEDSGELFIYLDRLHFERFLDRIASDVASPVFELLVFFRNKSARFEKLMETIRTERELLRAELSQSN